MNRVPEHKASSCGFTLLEVLVALAVFSISLVVVMEVFSANLRNLSVVEHQVYASARAESMMRELFAGDTMNEGPASGTTEDGYRYNVDITKILQERYQPTTVDLFQVKLSVAWNEGKRERSITLVSYRMRERKP